MAETFRYFVDSNLLIAHIRQKSGTTLLEMAVEIYGVPNVCALVVYEINFGGYRSRRDNEFRTHFSLFNVVPIDEAISDRAAKLEDTLLRKNITIGLFDTFIAATALELKYPLLTANRRHFERVDGLELLPLPTP